ncbi:hypothetical protein [Hahella sp. HN01]|uniref:hypothetical protein n=1 Tax=Hahella sp. HN01 TaxID=2847262 RepID=UPI001C1F0226|nr:hypothetical protein [Hahella sp. HN01]MBU6955585.1 hypothetical protein [Hahella sp. HN01]
MGTVHSNTPDSEIFKKVCADRFFPVSGKKDITSLLNSYLPFDTQYNTRYSGRNLFGMKIATHLLESGRLYSDYYGQRLIIEVGCSSVIFLQISPETGDIHHHFFIQSHQEFLADVNTRHVARLVAEATAPVETIVKYEMYFMMGFFSTVSVPMWLAVTGSNATYLYADSKVKSEAYTSLLIELGKELENIRQYAPTLYGKIIDFITSEKNALVKRTVKELPRTILTDEGVRGQVAGILYGKYVNSPQGFAVWNLVFTLLLQAAIKSITKLPSAMNTAVDQRYSPILALFQQTDWNNIEERKKASTALMDLMKQSGVNVTLEEADKILTEITAHPAEVRSTLTNLERAFKDFKRKVG